MVDHRNSFFQFRPFDEEIEYKFHSASFDTHEYYGSLKAELLKFGLTKLDLLDELIGSIDAKLTNEPYQNYMNHPLRVTMSYVALLSKPTIEEVLFGLSHNVIELQIQDGLEISSENLKKIQTISIDRKREKDKVYRKEFYDQIEFYSPDLLLFKALDKLDNTLSWVFLDLDQYHIDVVLEEVCPRLSKYNEKVSSYLENLVYYTIDEKNKKKFRLKYDK
ncbi:hypothetical protein [Leptospira perdikensis]|uniref:HD domain-containing protein n=1 Tax=Leptospira perdikensis TaxID=2484948 RepID=A0A4R9JM06_9LEPT|nr:hypothetical protein [Leptospira perdikensis]TGL45841.1 hypothetical protein EHQ49_00185 [Leptospira perdikensis]